MRASQFDFNLPQNLIAQRPVRPRDHSRLMVVNKQEKKIFHHHFFDLPRFLKAGDLIIWNNSRVFKARLYGRLVSRTGRALRNHSRDIEIFLVRPMENDGVWRVLARPGRHVRAGAKICFADGFFCDVLLKEPNGTILAQFADNEKQVRKKANRYGHVPVPPYIKDRPRELDFYQTIYAKREGSVAAPTAGFHFTPKLIKQLKNIGVEFAAVTLHVGLGTFLPVKSEIVEDHSMHSEWVQVTEGVADKINRAKREKRRVIAVGTTTARTLEGVAAILQKEKADRYCGEIDIFITPGFEFKIVDALITNFHLPKSTLLMLVAAFAGSTEYVLRCYREAVAERYRFYSFGDSMFIH